MNSSFFPQEQPSPVFQESLKQEVLQTYAASSRRSWIWKWEWFLVPGFVLGSFLGIVAMKHPQDLFHTKNAANPSNQQYTEQQTEASSTEKQSYTDQTATSFDGENEEIEELSSQFNDDTDMNNAIQFKEL